MKIYSENIEIFSKKNDFVDLTEKIQKIVAESKITDGICTIFVKHTTSFIIINENEPNLKEDFISMIYSIVPENKDYRHNDGNAHAHLKEIFLDSGKTIPVSEGKLDLGTWQSILFFDPDGPRERKIEIKIIGN